MKEILKNIISLILIFFIPIISLLCTSSCKQNEKEKPNIILIIPDALRAKQLPSYGYKKIETESIDNLVENGVVFKSCFVATTADCHFSLLRINLPTIEPTIKGIINHHKLFFFSTERLW